MIFSLVQNIYLYFTILFICLSHLNALTNSKGNQVYLRAPVHASVIQLESKLFFGSAHAAHTWGVSTVENIHFCWLICHWLEWLWTSHSVSLTFIIHLYPQSWNVSMTQLWNIITEKWWLLPLFIITILVTTTWRQLLGSELTDYCCPWFIAMVCWFIQKEIKESFQRTSH